MSTPWTPELSLSDIWVFVYVREREEERQKGERGRKRGSREREDLSQIVEGLSHN